MSPISNNLFSMNMMRPKVKRHPSAGGFMRNFKHKTTSGELISSFTGTYRGGLSGTVTCALGNNYAAVGDNIHTAAVFFGFSFADTCPDLSAATNTLNRTGWYYYAKIEWWPGGNYDKNLTFEAPTNSNTRSSIGYENFWTYNDWKNKLYGVIMNGAKWVCIGIADEIFACGEII